MRVSEYFTVTATGIEESCLALCPEKQIIQRETNTTYPLRCFRNEIRKGKDRDSTPSDLMGIWIFISGAVTVI
jgi:hypothetical protein